MEEWAKRGIIGLVIATGTMVIGGATIGAALSVGGIAAISAMLIGWGLDWLTQPFAKRGT